MSRHSVDVVRRAHGVDCNDVEAGEAAQELQALARGEATLGRVQTPGATDGSNESMSQDR
jgi:hypothetical protein